MVLTGAAGASAASGASAVGGASGAAMAVSGTRAACVAWLGASATTCAHLRTFEFPCQFHIRSHCCVVMH